MPTVLFVRHGRTAANASAVLAGWTPGVTLDGTGEQQAASLAERLAPLPLRALVSSPLERCRQTAQALATARDDGLEVTTDDRLGECRYGDWTGQELKQLAKDPMWKVVQQHPSAAVFPGPEGEPMAAVQHRAVAAVRQWNVTVEQQHGPDALWVACSHGDVIKSVLADAMGLHLDLFQRIVVNPCSVSVVRYTPTRPFVLRVNDLGADLTDLIPPKRRRRSRRSAGAGAAASDASGDAVVGGGVGGER